MVKTQLARRTQVLRHIVAEDREGMAHLFTGFRRSLGTAAHVGIVEVGQTVRLAAGFAIGTLARPFASRTWRPHEDEHAFDRIRVFERDTT